MPRSAVRRSVSTLAGRLFLWHAVAVVGVLSVLGIVLAAVLEAYFVDQLTDGLARDARAVRETLPPAGPRLQPHVVNLGDAMGVRITIVRSDGVVLADSQHDPATMENHRDRPEVRDALRGGLGVASRPSATIGVPFRYVAISAPGRIVRIALPLTTVESRLSTIRLILLVGFALAALAGILAAVGIVRTVSRPLARIASAVERVGRGDLSVQVPEEGTHELRALAGTVNSMRGEVASRIDAVEEERRTRDAVLSALDEGVVLLDGQGTILYQNDSAVRLLGARLRSGRELVPASLAELTSSVAAGNELRETDVTVGPGGRTLHATALPIPGEDAVLLVLRDVTERLRLDAIRRDFVSNASHELKTPAASIRALAETIGAAAHDDPDAAARFAQQLEREALRLSRVVADLLDLSRLEGERKDRAVVMLDELTGEEVSRYLELAQERGLSLRMDRDGAVRVAGSARELRLLVRNLIENALQYTPSGGKVNVRTSSQDGNAVLVVSDTGIGIPTRDRERIFERFYRIDPARSRETGGTGLGLSIVKHVVENHGGTVRVESELGKGTAFTVVLPLA